jgi:cytoskeletal protein CcmA (bactofilin family)
MRFEVLIACAFMLAVPFTALEAETVLRTGETVSVSEEQSVVGDFYVAAGISTISGKVEGDLLAVAGKTTINGEVTGDVLILGGNVDVHGTVGDDVRVVGGEVIIAEPVAGDIFVFGGTVQILSTASVGGDVLIYGANVEIAGTVAGDVLGSYKNLRLAGAVGGDVSVTAETLSLGDSAVVTGNLTYVSETLVNRSANAQVNGNVVRNDAPVGEEVKQGVQHWLVPILILVFTTLVWFLFSRKTLQKAVDTALSYKPRPLLMGISTIILLPIVSLILFVTVLGSLLGLVLLLSYITLIALSVIATPAVLGQLVMKIFNQSVVEMTLVSIGAGILLLILSFLIPLLGFLVVIATLVVTFGALVDNLITFYNT